MFKGFQEFSKCGASQGAERKEFKRFKEFK